MYMNLTSNFTMVLNCDMNTQISKQILVGWFSKKKTFFGCVYVNMLIIWKLGVWRHALQEICCNLVIFHWIVAIIYQMTVILEYLTALLGIRSFI